LFRCFIFLSVVANASFAQQSVYSRIDIVASSEPVPIVDMVSGWDGSYQSGEVVFADAAWLMGFGYDLSLDHQTIGRVQLEREYRRYYYLNFDKDTSDYYRALELGNDLQSDKKLNLVIKQFEAPGISLAFNSTRFDLVGIGMEGVGITSGLKLTLYQPGHFQFASIKGIAEKGDVSAASALINYRYDDDKLLDHQAVVDKGLGFSMSANVALTFEQWQGSLILKDMVNRFEWKNGAYTQGCINIGGGSKVQCETEGAASGISGQGKIKETIPYTLTTQLTHSGLDLSLHGVRHDAYYRLGFEKGTQTSLGRLAFFLYYPRLIGASWQTKYFDLQLGADTLKFSQARNIQLNMGVNWHW